MYHQKFLLLKPLSVWEIVTLAMGSSILPPPSDDPPLTRAERRLGSGTAKHDVEATRRSDQLDEPGSLRAWNVH